MRRKVFSWSDIRSENGSNVAQASGVALAAAILISTILTMTPLLSSQVERAFVCLAAALGGGGGGCSSGGASAGMAGTFQVTTARLPNLPDSYDQPTGSRGLTPEERALAELLFGPGALNLDTIKIKSVGWLLGDRAYTQGNTIYWPKNRRIDPGTIAHELTHTYQYQKRGWAYWREAAVLQGKYELHKLWPDRFADPYSYGDADGLRQARSAGKSFADFNVEQQAQIVGDYYERLRNGQDTSAYELFIRDAQRGLLDDRQTAPTRPRGWLWNPPWAGDWPDAP